MESLGHTVLKYHHAWKIHSHVYAGWNEKFHSVLVHLVHISRYIEELNQKMWDLIKYDIIWYMAWYDMIWYDMMEYDTIGVDQYIHIYIVTLCEHFKSHFYYVKPTGHPLWQVWWKSDSGMTQMYLFWQTSFWCKSWSCGLLCHSSLTVSIIFVSVSYRSDWYQLSSTYCLAHT